MSEPRSSHAPSSSAASTSHSPADAQPADVAAARPPVRVEHESHTGRIVFGAVALVVAAIAGIALLATRRTASAAREMGVRTADEAKGPIVRVANATLSPEFDHRVLLGEARPYASVTFYAKVSGYLRTVNVDMGDHVSVGQVLATIESPETDQAYLAAKADYDNKDVIAKRVAQLLERKMVSPQETDQARTDAAMAQERLKALSEERDYETLRAPFAGQVTARYADPGALVQNAAAAQTSALPVVTVAETDSLRIFVYLDQADAAHVHVGTPAHVTLTERPGFSLPVRVARVSGDLDPKTRKMLTEIDVNDHGGTIVPGGFVQVDLEVPTQPKPQAPVEALLVRDGKTMVATVGADSRVHFRAVVIAANDGSLLTFAAGVSPGDRLALSLGSAVLDSARVQLDSTNKVVPTVVSGAPAPPEAQR